MGCQKPANRRILAIKEEVDAPTKGRKPKHQALWRLIACKAAGRQASRQRVQARSARIGAGKGMGTGTIAIMTPTPSALPYVALAVSCCAFLVALRNYRRKSGMLVRGTFTIASSQHSKGKYLSSFVIENLKDRAITIFAIYLQLGPGYYIKIDDFENQPLILKAFETLQKQYGPIEFYGVNDLRLGLDNLFNDKRVKKRLVLSTGDGKYIVSPLLRTWNPVIEMFRNHMAAVVRPVRSIYKGHDIGGTIKFVIEFVNQDGTEEIVPIHPKDYELVIFKNFQLTATALESKANLEAFLQQQTDAGKLTTKSFAVLDMDPWRQKATGFYSAGPREAVYYSPVQYHVLGRTATIYSSWKQRRENRKILLTAKKLTAWPRRAAAKR